MPTIPENLTAVIGQYNAEQAAQQSKDAATTVAMQKLQSDVAAAQAEIEKLKAAPVITTGYDVAPGQSVQAILNKAGVGKTVRVAPGTYAEKPSVPAGVRLLNADGTSYAGTGWATFKVNKDATFEGGKITGYTGGTNRNQGIVQLVGDNATVKGVTFDKNSGSAMTADNVQSPSFIENHIVSCGGSWIQFGGGNATNCAGARVIGNIVDLYNADKNDIGGPGVNKITRLDGAQFLFNQIKGGFGPQLWFDIGPNRNMLIAYNSFYGAQVISDSHQAAGVWVEISDSAQSYFIFNQCGGMPVAISLQNTSGWTVAGNTLDGASIQLRNQQGRAYTNSKGTYPMKLENLLIGPNTLLNGAVQNNVWKQTNDYPNGLVAYAQANNISWR